ncbi:hypothetical protein G6M36_25585 [Agrobacterium tumefaciens]|nr:hypothetical protein [Agrobacterium tumefaciens]NTD18270.1 hypothetical protein [Agrobacterium tumefaciens]OCJ49798.1 hypothetical protein A6U94_13515 [Agrobacterium tumefaciens]
MGPEVLWVARVYHQELGELEWSVTEYPEGAISGTPGADVNGHELETDFDFQIGYSQPDVDPDDPYEDDDNEDGYVSSLLSSVTSGDAEEMREWFHANYEDPANSLPHSSADGGYQWINGGPYTTLEALQDEFDRTYSFEAIEAVAKSIEDEDGTYDWSPRDRKESSEERIFRLAERLNRHLPLAERIVPNEETGAFKIVANLAAKPNLLRTTLSRVEDALNDCLASASNGLSEQDHEVHKIRRMLSKYADDPQRIEMDATSARNSILKKIRTQELPKSAEIEDLTDALRDAAQGIRGTDPDIAENRHILQSTTIPELSPDVIQIIQDAAPVIEAITEGELQKQMRDDIAVLADYNGQLSGVGRCDGFGHDEIVRVTGRVSRMILAIRKTPEIVKKIADSSTIKVGDIIGSVTGIISFLGGIVTAVSWLIKFFS